MLAGGRSHHSTPATGTAAASASRLVAPRGIESLVASSLWSAHRLATIPSNPRVADGQVTAEPSLLVGPHVHSCTTWSCISAAGEILAPGVLPRCRRVRVRRTGSLATGRDRAGRAPDARTAARSPWVARGPSCQSSARGASPAPSKSVIACSPGSGAPSASRCRRNAR